MNCPRCGSEMYCPCENCSSTHPKGRLTWEWIDGELIKCTHCGYTAHADVWQDHDYEQWSMSL